MVTSAAADRGQQREGGRGRRLVDRGRSNCVMTGVHLGRLLRDRVGSALRGRTVLDEDVVDALGAPLSGRVTLVLEVEALRGLFLGRLSALVGDGVDVTVPGRPLPP